MNRRFGLMIIRVSLVLGGGISTAWGQGYGTDTQNVMMPASGGMAGVSVAQPQDVPSAVFGNPATLAQFHGTQFTLGGGWVEGYPTVTRFGFDDPNANYTTTSGTQGMVVPSIAVTQDLRSLGVAGTMGIGLAGTSGLGAEYRGKAPEGSIANNFSSEYLVLGMNMGVGLELTDRLSAGITVTLGTGFEQLGTVQTSAMVHDYALRGNFGVDYDLTPCSTVSVFYQTELGFNYPNAFLNPLDGTYSNLRMDQPETFGFGYANRAFLNGNLLIAADVYYKLWEEADFYEDIFVNQWAFAVGTQLTRGRLKYRCGYSYNSNPINHNVGSQLNGHPVLQDAIQFLQASSTGVFNQHRLTGGVGCQGFLFPSLDLDLFVGGLFKATDQFGDHTEAAVAVWYTGMGLTWRYGTPTCRQVECLQ
ncbi:MAG: hypothetical protein GXY83_09510 [Rhodopirellula sp.]|nr:hypothetical protein [Rhodopirellula sp.]